MRSLAASRSLLALFVVSITSVAHGQTITRAATAPASVSGGKASHLMIQLSGRSPAGGVVVSITNDSGSVTVPSTVTIRAGQKNASVAIATAPVTSDVTANLTVSLNGSSQTAQLTVRAPVLVALAVGDASDGDDILTGGETLRGMIVVTAPAPAGGLTVNMSSDTSAVSVPSSVTIPAGARKLVFAIPTTTVATSTTVTVSATLNGITVSNTFTLSP